MAQAKTELFEDKLNRQACWFKVLAHPARLQILQFLSKTKTCINGDISEELPLSRTTVNQHLKELKEIGLIVGHIEGVKTHYCLNAGRLSELQNAIFTFLKDLDIINNNSER